MATPIYDSTTNSSNVSGIVYTTRSFNHTVPSANNKFLVLFSTNPQGVFPSSITANGRAMSNAGVGEGINFALDTWYLASPDTGVNVIAITWPSPILADMASVSSFHGAGQVGQPEDAAGNHSAGSSTISDTLTISSNNSMYFASVASTTAPSLSDGETIVTNFDIGSEFLIVGYGFANIGSQTVSGSQTGGFEISLQGIAFGTATNTFDPLLLLDNV